MFVLPKGRWPIFYILAIGQSETPNVYVIVLATFLEEVDRILGYEAIKTNGISIPVDNGAVSVFESTSSTPIICCRSQCFSFENAYSLHLVRRSY